MALPSNLEVWEAVLLATKELPHLHRAMAHLEIRQRRCRSQGSPLYGMLEDKINQLRQEAESKSTRATMLVYQKMGGPNFVEQKDGA